jgi:hypothetical protein
VIAIILALFLAPVHVSVQNQWVQQIAVYELDEPMTCTQWTFGGGKPFNEFAPIGRTVFADSSPGCSPHAKLYAGLPGSLVYDCWFNVDNDTLTNGARTDCKMKQEGNDYEIVYRQIGQ